MMVYKNYSFLKKYRKDIFLALYLIILIIVVSMVIPYSMAGWTYVNETMYAGLPDTNENCPAGKGYGRVIIPFVSDLQIYRIQKPTLSTYDRVQICNKIDCSGTVYDNCTFSGDNCIFTGGYNLTANTEYYIRGSNSSGGSWNSRYKGVYTFPQVKTLFNVTNCIYQDSNNTECHDVLFYEVRNGTSSAPPPPPASVNYSITNTASFNINTSSFSDLNITSNLSIVGSTFVNSSMNITHGITTGLNNGCVIFYQKVCVKNASNIVAPMVKVNDTFFYYTFDDNDYLPGYYPFNYTYIKDYPYTLNNYSNYNNNYVKFNVFNFSTNVTQFFISVEFNAVGSSNLNIYYCNSSYSTGNPATSSNCVLVDVFAPKSVYSHSHNSKIKHQAIPVVIKDVTKTQTSYFLFIGQGNNVNQRWDFAYLNTTSYDNSSFNIGAYTTWSNTSNLFDIHVHSMNAVDYFHYFTTVYDNGTVTNSATVNDHYNITAYPPSNPALINPTCSQQFTIGNTSNTSIFVNWTAATDANNLSITYNVSLYSNGSFTFLNSTSSTSFTILGLNTSTINPLDYNVYILTCNSLGLCDNYTSACSFNVCLNSWSKTLQQCLGGASLIVYDADCSESYDLPTVNGTYEACNVTSYVAIVAGEGTMFIGIILIPLIIAAVLLYWGSQLEDDNLLKLVFQLFVIPLFWLSIHFGVVAVAGLYPDYTEIIKVLGDLTYYLGWILFIVGLFLLFRVIYAVYLAFQQRKKDKEEELYG